MVNFASAPGVPASADRVVGRSVVHGLENDNRVVRQRVGGFSVMEYVRDLSLSPDEAMRAYFMSEMDVCRRQLIVEVDDGAGVVVQAGSMQWALGDVQAKTGVKGVGDLFGKVVRGSVTGESAIKPEYHGRGLIALEPTWRHIILVSAAEWGEGIVVEDGMFLACSSTVSQSVQRRRNVSSAVAGGEGLFNLCLSGQGVVALESPVPYSELVEVELSDDTLRVDGPLAVAWSKSLDFRVERATASLVGSAASGEGLVNAYRGTGRVLMAPVR